jgi:hypothetical protein
MTHDERPTARTDVGRDTDSLPVSPPPTERDAAPSIAGYEVLGVLGHGGMGVVYQARQTKLARTVALKVIRAGAHADAEEVARFRTEAETVARLSHPNIVQIYEIGETEGLPFLALEYVAGGTLQGRLKAGPLSPREAAALVEALAGAVHLAHSRNVVHRDLKPANVLLQAHGLQPVGLPKITDFGLARRLDAAGCQTQTGAILGTPANMAPEQASGQPAGPAADVWALGTILYECLTCQPVFSGPNTFDILEQVRWAEPLPPSQSNGKVPRDLETICLKCLRKEPEKRYGSAQELANDLGRFLRGEPVAARPVGAAERLAKWARRKPAVAALLAVLVLLIGGGGGLTGFSYLRARDFDIERRRIVQAENEKAFQQQQKDQERKRDEQDAQLVESWAGALSLQSGSLQPAERDMLWSLAGEKEDRLKRLFFERMLDQPISAERLGNRAEWAVRAGVGFDSGRRDALAKRISDSLADPKKDARVRRAYAELTLALPLRDPERVVPACRFVVEDLRRAQDLTSLRRDAALLRRLSAFLGRDESAKLCEDAAAVFLDHLSRESDSDFQNTLLSGLYDVIAPLPPKRAAQLRGRALQHLVALYMQNGAFFEIEILAPVLTRATERVTPEDTAQAFATLLPILDRLGTGTAGWGLQQILEGLIVQLPQEVADREGWSIIDRWTNITNFIGDNGLMQIPRVYGIDGKIDPATEDADGLRILAQRAVLPRLAAHMTPEAAGRSGDLVLNKLSRWPNLAHSADLVRTLAALSDRLPADKADNLRVRASRLLRDKLAVVDKPDLAQMIGELFTLLSERLPPEEAAAVCRALRQKMAQPQVTFAAPASREAFALAARRMSAADAAKEIPVFLKELLASSDVASAAGYAQALAVQGERLQPDQAEKATADVLKKLKTVAAKVPLNHPARVVVPVLAEVLANLLDHLPPDKADDPSGEALGLVLDRIARAKTPEEMLGLSPHLVARLTERLSARRAAQLEGPVRGLLDAFTKEKKPEQVAPLAQVLALLSEKLAPEEATKTAYAVLAKLAATPYAVNFFVLEERMEVVPGEEPAAGRARIAVLQAWARLPGRPGPEQSAELAPKFLEALDRSTSPKGLVGNARLVGRLASRLTPPEAGRAAAVVLERLGRTDEPGEPILRVVASSGGDLADQPGWSEHLKTLSTALAELAARMDEPALVELLKRPDCVRRAPGVLRAVLGKRLGVDFADSWAMAEWLRQHRPDLDLDSPPQQPASPPGQDAR